MDEPTDRRRRLQARVDFALRLEELRTAAGMTQEALAERSGLSLGTIRNIEQALRSPAWETLLSLADALSVSLEEFRKAPSASARTKRGRPKKEG